jgi:kynurenine/2-aminoadipate aminotransferase
MATRLTEYASRLTRRSLARQPSAIRALQPLVAQPGMISLGGGMPNPSTFPFTKITALLRDGSEIELGGARLEASLQYSSTLGLPPLLVHLQALQESEHGVASDRQVCVTTGSADALSKAFDALLDEDDALLVESPTYSGSLAYLQPIGCQLVGVRCDADGLDPSHLEEILSGWDEGSNEGRRRPRVLYTIPTGGNPSGASLSLARRQRVYEVARTYDLLLLEDDPYHWLQFSAARGAARRPSLLSLDRDGRVLRFDSFSKLLASGIRLGWATGPPALIERIELHGQASNLHTCGLAQGLVAALLDAWAAEYGGDVHAGFAAKMSEVAAFYQGRCDVFLAAAERHLGGLARWSAPNAGMFVWLELLGVADSHALITQHCAAAKVLLVPGLSFMPSNAPTSHVRAAFSTASDEEIDEALRRLAALLREQQRV